MIKTELKISQKYLTFMYLYKYKCYCDKFFTDKTNFKTRYNEYISKIELK